MKNILNIIFPLSRRAKGNAWFLLSMFLYLVMVIAITILAIILGQWIPEPIMYVLITIASVYTLTGIVFSILVNLRILK